MVCGVPQGIGNKGGFDGVPPLLVEVEMHEERGVEGCLVDSEMSDKVGETFARTEEWVRCGGVANLFPTGGILLVVESESGMGDATRIHQVIQRTVHSRVDLATNGEANILETEGLGTGIRRVGIQVFSGAQQPEEGRSDEIDGGFVELSLTSMSSVKGVRESSENCHIYGVGAIGWIVFIPESLEVSREYRVEFFGSRSLLSWIWLTQVGDPLANGKKGLIHRSSPDLVVTAVAVGEDEEISNLVTLFRHVTEGWVFAVLGAEEGPASEDPISGFGRLGDNILGGGLERRLEISLE